MMLQPFSDIGSQAGALFVAGFGIAMVELIKLHGADAMARDVILSELSIEDWKIRQFSTLGMAPTRSVPIDSPRQRRRIA